MQHVIYDNTIYIYIYIYIILYIYNIYIEGVPRYQSDHVKEATWSCECGVLITCN
jgi:hypothetical protein